MFPTHIKQPRFITKLVYALQHMVAICTTFHNTNNGSFSCTVCVYVLHALGTVQSDYFCMQQ